MQFPQPLERGVLVSRYKRFFADVTLDDGRAVTAHCPNPGAMLGLNQPGAVAWLSRSDSPTRKLAHTLEMVEDKGGALVGVNTLLPNALVDEALAEGRVPQLADYHHVRREVRYGDNSRADFLLEGAQGRCWVEVKGVTLSRKAGLAEWPDCVSARGARHMAELANAAALGDRAAVLFVVQRDDCREMSVARDLDPAFAKALAAAMAAGVEVLCYGCDLGSKTIRLAGALSWRGAATE